MRISWGTLVLVVFLAGCGGGGGGGVAAPAAGTSSAATSEASVSSVSSASTPTPTPTPTPSPSPGVQPSPLPSPQPQPTPPNGPAPNLPIIPLPNLSSNELAQFNDGEKAFVASAAGLGLGPLFNRVACVQCHDQPIGGATDVRVTRFGRTVGGVFDPLVNEGGSLLHSDVVPPMLKQTLPADANVTALRRSTTVLGFGLIEAIPDSAILAFAQVQAAQHPAQAGVVNFVTSASDHTQHVGRFGWKCQQALLLDFAGDSFSSEMGVSNALFPIEYRNLASPFVVPPDQVDDQPDTNGRRRIDRVASFMRGLAPPPRNALDPNGAAIFGQVGCAVCHNPSYTAVSGSAAINGQNVSAYSDFLLHDIGTSDGIGQNGAPPSKMRTAPLTAMARNPFFLHDGSAATVEDAIARHQGEAASSVATMNALSPQDRATLLAFIKSL